MISWIHLVWIVPVAFIAGAVLATYLCFHYSSWHERYNKNDPLGRGY